MWRRAVRRSPGLEDDDDLPNKSADGNALEPSHLEGEKYLPGLEGDPDGAILENWTDADWASWFNDEVLGGPKADIWQLDPDDFRFVAEILQRTVVEEDASGPLGDFGSQLRSDDPAWKFARLSPAWRERLFHLLPEMRVGDGEPPEPPPSGPSTTKVAVIAGTTLATIVMAVLIGLVARDGGSPALVATAAPSSEPAQQPQAPDASSNDTSAEGPTEDEDVAGTDATSSESDGEGSLPSESGPDPEPSVAAAPITVIYGGTPDGSFQVQVLGAPPYDQTTDSYEVDVAVTNEDEQEFLVDGEFVDAATYLAATFDSDGNLIPDSTATAEFFDGRIFMEFLTPGYPVPARVVDAEIPLIVDGTTIVIVGSSTESDPTG